VKISCINIVKTVSLFVDGGFLWIVDAGSEVLWRADVIDLQRHGIHKGDRLK
jgi:hypothetical protein